MDVTPELIEQIDFTEKFRGYDQDQVDDFLERVGATISRLTTELNEAAERNHRLESQPSVGAQPERAPVAKPVAEAAPRTEVLDEQQQAQQATRTLVLAQRTADATVAEAREEADLLLSQAK